MSLGEPPGEFGDDLPLEDRPGLVVGQTGGSRALGGTLERRGVEPERLTVEVHHARGSGRLPVAYGRGQHAPPSRPGP